MSVDRKKITELLQHGASGDERALQEVAALVYAELRQIARGYMKRERSSHTLQPTALVNEAFLRLFEGKSIDWESRSHFYTMAARVMRHILIDHAKARRAERRGGGAETVSFEEVTHVTPAQEPDVIALDAALEKLALADEDLAKLVELRYFAGLSIEEVARVLKLSTGTVKRRWREAKVWLFEEMKRNEAA
jgi:RNA polymerase sigma factor (TIGR02999 family)